MKIITYNFKNTRDLFLNKVLKKRIDSSVEMFKEYLPDIIGMQEINKKTLSTYKNILTDYTIIGSPRHSFGLSNEYNPLFLKNSSILLKNSKTYSLSENITNLGKKIPNSLYPRICVAAHIIYNGNKYLVINTHLDHQSDIIRKLELKILNNIIKLEKKDNEHLIVIGDFNVNKCDYLREFLSKNDLIISNKNTGNTMIEYLDSAIDYILVSKKLKVEKSVKITKKYNDIYASDHYPIYTEIK